MIKNVLSSNGFVPLKYTFDRACHWIPYFIKQNTFGHCIDTLYFFNCSVSGFDILLPTQSKPPVTVTVTTIRGQLIPVLCGW